MSRYVCSRCGGGQVTILGAHPSIDDRFALGYCTCAPEPVVSDPRRKRVTRPVVQLVRNDLFTGPIAPTLSPKKRERQALKGSELW